MKQIYMSETGIQCSLHTNSPAGKSLKGLKVTACFPKSKKNLSYSSLPTSIYYFIESTENNAHQPNIE